MATTLTKNNFAHSGVSAMVPSVWSDMMQVPLRRSLVSDAVANNEFRANLSYGDTVNYPYLSETSSEAHTAGSEFTATSAAATNESLVVDTARRVVKYIEDLELLQSKYSYQVDLANDAGYQLSKDIDTAILLETTAAASGLIDGISHVAASALTGGAITATSGNIAEVFAAARKALRKQNVEEAGDWAAVITPDIAEKIELYGTEKGFNVADATIRNGYAGRFLGFEVYISNNLPDSFTYFGRKGQIHSVVQAPPKVQIKDVHNKAGVNMLAICLYGVKAFLRHKSRYLAVKMTT